MKTPTQNEIEEYINEKNILPIRIIHLAIVSGAVVFAIVCFVIYSIGLQTPIEYYDEAGVQNILAIALIIVALFDYSIVFMFPGMLIRLKLAGDLIKKGPEQTLDAGDLLGFAVTHQIIKLALLEGVTLFGLVIFLISVTNKSIYFELVPWIGIVPLIVMLGYVVVNFPTRQKMIDLIVYKILPEIS